MQTDVLTVEGRQVLRCRRCRRTWPPYDTSPSPAPDYRTAYRTAPPEYEEDEALAALEASLDTATATAKASGRRPAPMARRLLLLRRAALADRRAYATELDHCAATPPSPRPSTPWTAPTPPRRRCAPSTRTPMVSTPPVTSAPIFFHPIWDDEPDAGRAYVRQEYAEWTRAERAVLSGAEAEFRGTPDVSARVPRRWDGELDH
ncbi:hypothetical protein ACFFTQ_00510 [Streptomyces roseofulvus]|uniref:hypothetical protein n=1 Tax=Streptomyces roseofulvus TaxID=33902 RepID=UPI0031F7C4B3